MFRNSRNANAGFGSVLLQRISALLLVLFGMGSTGWAVPVLAAPPGDGLIIYRMVVTLPPEPICVDHTYDVKVRISANQQYTGEDNQPHDLTSEGISGRYIEAFAQDERIAKLSPGRLITGFALDVDAPGEVTFHLQAKKAGETTLSFETYIKEAVASQQEPYFGPREKIKVIDCKYKVKMTATDTYSGGGVTIWTAGNLDTEISGDGGEMQGSGSFASDSGFVGPPCSISYSEYQNPTTITGHLDDNDQLVLGFKYQPGQITSSVSCPDGGGSGSQTIDLTNTGIASATFPANGGTRAITFTYAGSDAPPGTMIIDVQPVSEEAGS